MNGVLDQDVDVVSLANKSIAIGCFVGRTYTKILTETRKLTDNIRVTKNGPGSGVNRMLKSSESAFYHTTDRLNPFGKSVEFDILFLALCQAYASHASMIVSKFWCHENETDSLYFGPLRKRSLSLSFCTILRSPVTTWPHGVYRNSEPGQVLVQVMGSKELRNEHVVNYDSALLTCRKLHSFAEESHKTVFVTFWV